MNEPLLSLQGVHTHIGAYHILHGVDLLVPRGEVTLLLGRNGAGKTTTLRTIMGLWPAAQGRIRFGPTDISALPTPAIAGLGLAYVPENMGIFADLSVKENMLLAARQARRAGMCARVMGLGIIARARAPRGRHLPRRDGAVGGGHRGRLGGGGRPAPLAAARIARGRGRRPRSHSRQTCAACAAG
jgi:ABC-type branched-subunit amino acid transport system ATPase component